MDAGLIPAAAGLIGASIGGAMPFLGSWIVQQKQVRAQWLGQDRLRRQDLYKEFIQEASKCYADAIQRDNPDIAALVILHGKISRMRVISSPQVLAAADKVLRRIVDVYVKPAIPLTGLLFGRCSTMVHLTSSGTSVNLVGPKFDLLRTQQL
jgi:hypothetical protein